MIEALLPSAVVAVESVEDVPGEALFPGEEALIAQAIEARRREFIAARRCAPGQETIGSPILAMSGERDRASGGDSILA